MVRITVPKTPRGAYDPDRTAGTLLHAQLHHLEWAVRPAGERGADRLERATNLTEREVATRIEQLMTALHQQTAGRPPVIPAAARGTSSMRLKPRKRRIASRRSRR